MPLQAQEVLDALVAATVEAKTTVRELHEARKLALDVSKKDRERITTLIVTEVEKQVGELARDARVQMGDKVDAVIDGFVADWRQKLGL